MEAILQILLIIQEVISKLIWIFWGLGCLTINKPFSFDADPDHDPDAGISNGIFTTMWRRQL